MTTAVLAGAVAASAVLLAAGALLLPASQRPAVALATELDGIAVAAGLGIDQISVTGYHGTLLDDVFAALALPPSGSILGYDTAAARTRLEALPWVRSATIFRQLPSSLDVRISERTPAAVWQNRQMLFLIDADGRTLEPIAPSEHAGLPVVVGEGADREASRLLALLQPYPELGRRLAAAVRIADRRWTLKLRSGLDVLLPADGEAAAIAAMMHRHGEERLLDRAVAVIDLRVPGQTTLTPQPSAAVRRTEG